MDKDTIVANVTPLIPSPVSIIRISGEKALEIGKTLFKLPKVIEERKAYFGKIVDKAGNLIDEGIFIYFKEPRSFTGEDVVEIYPHGSVPVVKKIIGEIIDLGARFAEPGEFTKRAFLNGKIDLTQAEAIADLIEAKSEKASKAALNILEGKLSKEVNTLKDSLLNLISLIEAELNFPEDVDELDRDIIVNTLADVLNTINRLISTYKKGEIIKSGIKLAIVGRPNVGKSSLFNKLLGFERSIVSEIHGTTRDFIEESISIRGIPVVLLDTAGLRETADKIEKLGIERTNKKIEEADVILFVFDLSEGITDDDLKIFDKVKDKDPIVVGNKLDLVSEKEVDIFKKKYYFKNVIFVSTKNHKNLDLLEEEIFKKLGIIEESDSEIYINLRHYKKLENAKNILEKTVQNIDELYELKEILMLEIKEAVKNLEEITGEITTEDVLGNIFNKFCIGK
ncbi:tRNA uridine-5-carboxymethylaminomethyl(34) synthesis GTPase MnmE [Persephonella sp.]